MPSSRNATILSGIALADTDDVTVTSWQPVSLTSSPGTQHTFTLPRFETDAPPTNPSLRAFAISRTAGIPEHLLAAETAAARAAGYAAGYASGIDDARAATRDRLAAEAAAGEAAAAARAAAAKQAFDALFEAADDLEALAVQSVVDIEEEIVSSAWAIATAIIGQALTDDGIRSRAAITRALALAPSDETVTVAVSPSDFAVLAAADAGDGAPTAADTTALHRMRGLRTVTIISDDSLAEGDSVATCGATTIDARLSTAVDRVKQVLEA